jgi:hypothetical protein
MHIGENARRKETTKRIRRRWDDYIKTYIREMWTGFIWLRIGTSGGLLWTR